MATKKISELTAIAGADNSDVLVIVDVSEGTTKKIAKGDLLAGAGHTIEIQLNQQTYQLEFKLKNEQGTVLSTETLDLPSENAVTNIEYSNGILTITKQSGATSQVDISGLINGLVTETTFNQTVQSLQDSINAKYTKPSGGIPKSDLSNEVKNILDKAENTDNKVVELTEESTDEQYPSAKAVYEENLKLKSQVDTLKEITSQMPQVSGEGEDVYLADTIKAPFEKFDIIGHSEQESTTGKQLYSGGDQTFVKYKDVDIEPIPAGDYIISGNAVSSDTDAQQCLLIFYKDSTNVGSKQVTRGDFSLSITLSDTANKISFYASNSMANADGDTATFTNLMISANGGAYEPFTGGQPAPSPSYPYPVKSCGENVNIFDLKGFLTERGVTYTENDDGSLTFTPINSQTYMNPLQFNNTDINVSLSGIITNVTSAGVKIQLLNSSNNVVGEISSSTTLKENVNASKLRFDWTTIGTITMKNIKLEKGTQATPYSPYGCGNVNVKVQSKNLLKLNDVTTSNGIISTKNADGSIKINGTSTTGWFIVGYIDNVEIPAGTYTFSIDRALDFGLRLNVTYEDNTYKYMSPIVVGNTSTTYTFKKKVISYAIEVPSITTGATIDYTIKFQLEPGSTATSYVPHEEQTISFPLAQGQKLMEGDYPDDDEKVHHVSGEYVFTGNENWQIISLGDNRWQHYINLANVLHSTTEINIKSNIAKGIVIANRALEGNNNSVYTFTGGLAFRLDEFTTTEAWKNYLAEQYANGTPVKVQYKLATEETEDFTEEQKEAWEQIKEAYSYKGGTYISSPDEVKPRFEVSALRDLNAMYDNVTNALISLGANM